VSGFDMTMVAYQIATRETAIYPGSGSTEGLRYTGLGLAGEAGEVCEQIKKAMRDDGGEITKERRIAIGGELGDVLWYVAQVAECAGLDLGDIACMNVAKLRRRKEQGKLQGSGSDR